MLWPVRRLWHTAALSLWLWLSPAAVWLWLWLRPGVKWLLRRTTRLCELQRICYATGPGAERGLAVELCLERSRAPAVLGATARLDEVAARGALCRRELQRAACAVLLAKRVDTRLHSRFQAQLEWSLSTIWGYRQLLAELRCLRKTPVSWETHGDTLRQLWRLLMPDTVLEADLSPRWGDIGFQGRDPCTDFRGMGTLGLLNLCYFARSHPSAARHVLLRAAHPQWGYSFAIVGINLTALVLGLCEDGAMRAHFYNVAATHHEKGPHPPSLTHFQQVFSYAVMEFDALWRAERPRDIMEFSRVRDLFEAGLRDKLRDPRVVLRTCAVLENV